MQTNLPEYYQSLNIFKTRKRVDFMKKNVIIIGAAGRDFHNFNTYYRNNENYNVVAFTAAQIPDIFWP